MNIALDVGTHEFRSLRIANGKLIARRCRAAYAVVDDTVNHRTMLKQASVSYAVGEEQLLIYGDDAERVSQLFRIPCLELLPGGDVPADDPPARQMIAALIESLIGRVPGRMRRGEPKQARAEGNGAICALTLPHLEGVGCPEFNFPRMTLEQPSNFGGKLNSGHPTPTEWTSRHREFISRLPRLHGYVPLELSAPQALVLAELESRAFTGIGLVFGAGSTQAGLIHRGNVVAHCSVPYAGHWIDLRLARAQQVYFWDARGNKYLDVDKTRAWKESFDGSLREPVSSRDQQLADLHRGMVEFTLREAAATFAPEIKRLGMIESLPLVVAGGTARIPGFRDLLLDVLPAVSLPVDLRDVRLAIDDYTIARGGLIRAELEAGESGGVAA